MCGVDYASDGSVRKRFFSTLENKNHDEHFTKTGLGQTLKTLLLKPRTFCAGDLNGTPDNPDAEGSLGGYATAHRPVMIDYPS